MHLKMKLYKHKLQEGGRTWTCMLDIPFDLDMEIGLNVNLHVRHTIQAYF